VIFWLLTSLLDLPGEFDDYESKGKHTGIYSDFPYAPVGKPVPAFGKNLHLIDQLSNGFKLYRSGEPSEADLREYERLGIKELAVLSGDANSYEKKNMAMVPGLTVVYDQKAGCRCACHDVLLEMVRPMGGGCAQQREGDRLPLPMRLSQDRPVGCILPDEISEPHYG